MLEEGDEEELPEAEGKRLVDAGVLEEAAKAQEAYEELEVMAPAPTSPSSSSFSSFLRLETGELRRGGGVFFIS
jgi:hypothetical protein